MCLLDFLRRPFCLHGLDCGVPGDGACFSLYVAVLEWHHSPGSAHMCIHVSMLASRSFPDIVLLSLPCLEQVIFSYLPGEGKLNYSCLVLKRTPGKLSFVL